MKTEFLGDKIRFFRDEKKIWGWEEKSSHMFDMLALLRS
jgi:hypothetical protein